MHTRNVLLAEVGSSDSDELMKKAIQRLGAATDMECVILRGRVRRSGCRFIINEEGWSKFAWRGEY